MPEKCIINQWIIDEVGASLIHQESGEQRRLGEYQLKLLLILIDHAGQLLSREELNQLVWERRVVGNNSLPNAIHALRAALEDDGKQQRVIKTVPKKGYILDAEFCHFITINVETPAPEALRDQDAVASENTIQLPQENNTVSVLPAPVSPEWEVTAAPPKKTRLRGWVASSAIVLITLVLLAAIWVHNLRHTTIHFAPVQIENISQIRLLHLVYTPAKENIESQDLPKLLGEPLRQLNIPLRQRHTRMDIYAAQRGTTLSLTLNLFSPCAHQQLAMGIAGATTHPDALRQLLVEETERKLNEMAPCNN